MTLRSSAAAVVVVLAATAMWAQSGSPSAPVANPAPTNSRTVYAESNIPGIAAQARAQDVARLRMDEMRNTLSKMHALLKQMQAKTAASSPKDPMAKANLEMWGLMLGDLDKQYEQLRIATHAREDLEARRAALYKQADAKAAAEQRAKAAGAAQAAGGVDSPRVAPAAASPAPARPAAAVPATPQVPPSSSPN